MTSSPRGPRGECSELALPLRFDPAAWPLGRPYIVDRIPTVAFQRTGLPPAPVLLRNLHRVGSATACAWHPWMLRVLDLGQAVRLRGWPDDLDITIPLDVTTDTGDTTERFTLRITAGKGELAPSACDGRLRLTRRQFAVW